MRLSKLSIAGIAAAGLCAVAYFDWLLVVRTGTNQGHGGILNEAAKLIMEHDARQVASAIRTVLSVAGLMSCLVAAALFMRAANTPAVRQVAWLHVAYAAFAFLTFFAGVDDRYQESHDAARVAASIASGLLFGFMVAAIARFVAIFPRPVDGESVWRDFWTTSAKEKSSRSIALMPWHRMLVDGRVLWIIPLVILAFNVAVRMIRSGTLESWGGVLFVVMAVAVLAYVFYGLPFAYASTTHLFRNGTADERRRVSWLRAVLIGTAVVLAVLAAVMAMLLAFEETPQTQFQERVMGTVLLVVALLPTLFIMALTFALLYGGALDPGVAITRMTLWSLLGVIVSLGFILLERFVALKVTEYFALPPATGSMAAGTAIAATFVPLRNHSQRMVEQMTQRWLPIASLAAGSRVVKTVAITDLSGYTALAARDESSALVLGALLKRQAEKICASWRGRVVKGMGDAVILTFELTDDAIAAVRALHSGFDAAAVAVGVDPLPLHSSVHRGEIVEARDGDIYGQTVNVASRLVDVAGKGEIVLSDAARADITQAVALASVGERRFKNVPDPVACFRVAAVEA